MSLKVEFGKPIHFLEELSKEPKKKDPLLYFAEGDKPNHFILTDEKPNFFFRGVDWLCDLVTPGKYVRSAKLKNLSSTAQLIDARIAREISKYSHQMPSLNYANILQGLELRKAFYLKQAKKVGKDDSLNTTLQGEVKSTQAVIAEKFDQAISRVRHEQLTNLLNTTPSLEEFKNSGLLSSLFGKDDHLKAAAKNLEELDKIIKNYPSYEVHLRDYRSTLIAFLTTRGNVAEIDRHILNQAAFIHDYLASNSITSIAIPTFTAKTSKGKAEEIATAIANAPKNTVQEEYCVKQLTILKTLYEAKHLAEDYDRIIKKETANQLGDILSPDLLKKLQADNVIETEKPSWKNDLAKGLGRYLIVRWGPQLLTEEGRTTAATFIDNYTPQVIKDNLGGSAVQIALEIGILVLSVKPELITTPLNYIDRVTTGGRIKGLIPRALRNIF